MSSQPTDKNHRGTALVTGASRGLGQAIAAALAEAGYALVLSARNGEACEALAGELRAQGAKAIGLACDISDPMSVSAMVEAGRQAFGPIAVLINNAGVIDPIGDPIDTDAKAWARCIEINIVGSFHVTQTVLPDFRDQGSGVIVNISSGAAQNALEGWSAYCTAKAGLAMLTQSLHLEWGERGVRVYGFAPGTVETQMQEKIRASGLNPVSKMTAEDHLPASLPAGIVAWLCSDAATAYAGRELTVRDDSLRAAAGF